MSDEQVAVLREGSHATSAAFDEREKAVARLAEKLTIRPSSITDDDVKQLKKWFGEADLVELNLIIGTMNLTNRFNICFAVELEPVFAGK